MATITLKQLEAFVAVADLGSFRRAADRLNTTQPNVSNRIAQLEAQLRLPLLTRQAGAVRPTPRGAALLAAARTVLADRDALIAAAGDTALFQGVLRLGVTELVAHTWLPAFLREMRSAYPAVDVELAVDLSAALSPALFARDLDLTFQSGPFERQTPQARALGASPYVWVAAPALGLGGRALDVADLCGQPILTHARGTAPFGQLDAHFARSGLAARLVPVANLATGLQMACDGLGVACLPLAMIAPHLADGRLDRLAYGWTPAPLHFAARAIVDPAPPFLTGAIAISARLSTFDDKDN